MRILLGLIFCIAINLSSVAVAQLVREHDGQGLRSFHGQTTRIRRSFQSDAEARAVFKQILAVTGLAGMEDRVTIRASAETPNAEAFIEKSADKEERLIFYNAEFMQEINKKTKDYWSMVAIVAHEVGHHIRLHTMIPGRDHEFELEADYQAGFIMRRMGATLEQAQKAFRAIGPETPTSSHPGRAQRVQAATLGWADGAAVQQIAKPGTISASAPPLKPHVSEAAEAWGAARDATNPAVLEAFITRYKNTFYADLARARVEELKKKQIGIAAPPLSGSPTKPSDATAQAKTGRPPQAAQIALWRDAVKPETFRMQSVFPVDWSRAFPTKLAYLSGAKLNIEPVAPGSIVPLAGQLDAVSKGTLLLALGNPPLWAEKSSALYILGGHVAHGLNIEQFARWMRDRGEAELNEIYQNRLKLKVRSIACGIAGPEGIWFKKPLSSARDLNGLRVRTAGLSLYVMRNVGINAQFLGVGEVIGALKAGTIDGAEYSQPLRDFELGLPRVAGEYYYPSWHAPVTLYELQVNLDHWNDLSEAHRSLIIEACRQIPESSAFHHVAGPLQHGLTVATGLGLQLPERLQSGACW